MKGRLVDLSFGLNHKQRVTIELDGDFRRNFDELKDFDVNVRSRNTEGNEVWMPMRTFTF